LLFISVVSAEGMLQSLLSLPAHYVQYLITIFRGWRGKWQAQSQ